MTQVSKERTMSPKQAARRSGPIDKLLKPELFKALCDPTRVKLVACLAKCRRPCSVSEVAGCCEVDLSVVSRHLAQLERAGAVVSVKAGRTVFYTVNYADLCGSLRALADAIEECAPGAGCGGGGDDCCALGGKGSGCG